MKMWTLNLAIIACLCGASIAFTFNGCTIEMPRDLPKFEPIILIGEHGQNDTFKLLKPNARYVQVPLEARLRLYCVGRNNGFNDTLIAKQKRSTLELRCASDRSFHDASNDKKSYELKQLGCKRIPSASLKRTNATCAEGKGMLYETGFELSAGVRFQRVFDVCYSVAARTTYYTHNTINGAVIDFAVHESSRPSFDAAGMGASTATIDKAYKLRSQQAQMEQILGKAHQQYSNTKSFLSRGHLSPDGDFIFSYEQHATYFFVNVAPQYQAVNSGNWLRVEQLARKLAGIAKRELDIYNGYFGQLELRDSNNNYAKIELDEGIIPPAYYFKVIKDSGIDSAIVFITSVNPFAEAHALEPSHMKVCKNVCEAAGFQSLEYANIQRGYTYCCELDDFKKFYRLLPHELTAANLLKKSKY